MQTLPAVPSTRCRSPRLRLWVAVVACGALLSVGAAWAAYDHEYFVGYGPAGQVGSDLDMLYRNYNDACHGDGYSWSKAMYRLSDGSWVASVETYNSCIYNKAHLGPSDNYGYTYVQSKCQNTSGSYSYMRCNTSRP